MIKLAAQIGSNPLRYHIPRSGRLSRRHLVTAGESGELVGWKLPGLEPLYQVVCSALADTDGLIDFIVTPLRLVTNEELSDKIVTVHNDDRIRVITIEDGLCKNVSQHGLLPEKVLGLVENQHECRFLLCFGERTVYIVDSWSMKIVDSLQPAMDSYSVLKKGKVNAKQQLQLMDKQSKIYRFSIAALFDQGHLDVGSWLSNSAKAAKMLTAAIDRIKSEPAVISYRKLVDADLTEQMRIVGEKLEALRSQNIWEDIVVGAYRGLPIVNYLLDLQDEQPVVSNCFFVNNNQLWYFFGTDKGRVLGFPVVANEKQQIMVTNISSQVGSPVAYLSSIESLLIVSWENGLFNMFTTDNMDYTIQSSLNQHRSRSPQQQPGGLCLVDLNANKVFGEKLSSEIKYRLEIFSIARGKLGTQTMAFQLSNNEVMVLETAHRKISHYRGVPEGCRIHAIVQIEDYMGIAHSKGIDVYSGDRYERTIEYDEWVWSDYALCQQFKCKNDYHNIYSKLAQGQTHADIADINAMHMIEFTQRFYRRKLDYYAPSVDLLYETFGPLDSEAVSNDLYPHLHFIQRVYSERTIHSYCQKNATSIIRLKHNNVRRQKLKNTTYVFSCNLNKQLQLFAADKEMPLNQFEANFALFSLFFWDCEQQLRVASLYQDSKLKFLLQRRYTEHGIGRSFTIYFDNQHRNTLSSELVTYSSIATVSFLQVCSTKDIELADEMVRAVEYYTADRGQEEVKADVRTLSQMAVSDSNYILKACINILMSTALTQVVPLHPAYEYFILNLKNIEQTKNRLLSETETVWFVYLGIGFIYSTQVFDKEQVKVLIERLIQAIDLRNFEMRSDLMQIVLKVFNQGIKKWKNLISPSMAMKIYADLFRIFFYLDGLASVQPDDKKFNFCFESTPVGDNKRIRQQIVKTIIYLSKQFNNQFLQIMKLEALNQKPHPAYPASVIEILKQYIKSEKPSTNLVFYIELLLQCLSPMTPQLRKFVQKNVLATLQLMCSYKNISFNHPSQKLSLRTDSNIYIYCLRTSTRWRTISLKEEKQTENSVIEMSPQGTYIALLGEKLRIWRLNSGFWSGVLGAFSQGWTFEATGSALKWDDKEENITVLNENPSLNKCFKL